MKYYLNGDKMKPSRKSVKVKSITVYKMLHLIALIDDGDDDSITPSIHSSSPSPSIYTIL